MRIFCAGHLDWGLRLWAPQIFRANALCSVLADCVTCMVTGSTKSFNMQALDSFIELPIDRK